MIPNQEVSILFISSGFFTFLSLFSFVTFFPLFYFSLFIDQIIQNFNKNKISFTFLQCHNRLNFNDFITNKEFFFLNKLSINRKFNSLQYQNILKLLPILLYNSCIFNGSILCLQFLENLLVCLFICLFIVLLLLLILFYLFLI